MLPRIHKITSRNRNIRLKHVQEVREIKDLNICSVTKVENKKNADH